MPAIGTGAPRTSGVVVPNSPLGGRPGAAAAGRRAPARPDDRAVHGAACTAAPQDGRLALVRDAERPDVAVARARPAARLAQHAQRHLPDLLRIVLHPPGPGIVLRELGIGAPDNAPETVDDEHGRARRALIDRDDVGHG